MPRETFELKDVKPVQFDRVNTSIDGELIILQCKDKKGNRGAISISWKDVPQLLGLIEFGTRQTAETRSSLGKTDALDLSKPTTFFVVSGFQCGRDDHGKRTLLSITTRAGLRFDFAIPENELDDRGRSLPTGIAEELVSGGRDTHGKKQ